MLTTVPAAKRALFLYGEVQWAKPAVEYRNHSPLGTACPSLRFPKGERISPPFFSFLKRKTVSSRQNKKHFAAMRSCVFAWCL